MSASIHTFLNEGAASITRDPTSREVSGYYLELERLLDRIERSSTHYQVLGISRSASLTDVRLAYEQTVGVLKPSPTCGIMIPEYVRARIEAAFDRLRRSYSVLSNFGKRVEYDNTLRRRVSQPLPVDIPGLAEIMGPPEQAGTMGREAEVSRIGERRRALRHSVIMPVHVTGFERLTGMWIDLVNSLDVSESGIALDLPRNVRYGSVLRLSLSMPAGFRDDGLEQENCSVYALVRRVEPPANRVRIVGAEFLGNQAPAGYDETPWATFRFGDWRGAERRVERRSERAEILGIEYLDDQMKHIRQEVALTEDLSPSGARVYLKAAPPHFGFVRVTNLKRSFESLAKVRNRFVGSDGFERLCLRFIERRWPVEDGPSTGPRGC